MIVQKTPQRRRRTAFTLLELMVVVALLVVLAGVGGYYFLKQLGTGQKKAAMAQVQVIASAAQMYATDHNGTLPQTLQQLTQRDDYGGPYIEPKNLLDPWQKPYNYDPSGQHNQGVKPDVWCQAQDGTLIGDW